MKLYDMFDSWRFEGPIWVIGDPHFGDPDCKLMDPNWPTPDQQVKLINSKVGKKDTLIILGDVGDIEYVRKLKGYKVLIAGNHDKCPSYYKKLDTLIEVPVEMTRQELMSTYKYFKNEVRGVSPKTPNTKFAYLNDGLFDEVYSGPLFIGPTTLLSHEPVAMCFGLNIHGHSHTGPKQLGYDATYQRINVASNVIDYIPQRLDKIVDTVKVKDIHRVTIDLANEEKGV